MTSILSYASVISALVSGYSSGLYSTGTGSPSYPTTGILQPTGSIPSASSAIPSLSTTGKWNTTFNTYAETGSSPSGSSILPNYGASGTSPHVSGTASHPIPSKTAPYSNSTGIAAYHVPSGTALHSGIGNNPSAVTSSYYPGVTQDVVTTVITTSYVTTLTLTETVTTGSSQGVHTGLTTSTVYRTYTSTICTKCVAPPTPAPTALAKTQDVVTTVITTFYVTTCPVTETLTIGGSQSVHTGLTTSTVYTTYTSTICTKCVASPTPAPTVPAKTQDVVTTVIVHTILTTCPVTQTLTVGHQTKHHVTNTVSTIYQTMTSTICTKCVAPPTPALTAPAKIHDVITTVIVHTAVTTCPVTETLTAGHGTKLRVTNKVSTIYETEISTVCTQCVAPPTPAPTVPAVTQDAVVNVIVHTTVTTCPVTNTVKIGKTTSLEYTHTVSTVYNSITSTVCTKCVAPPTVIPGPGAPNVSVAVNTVSVSQEAIGSETPSLPHYPTETGGPHPVVKIVPPPSEHSPGADSPPANIPGDSTPSSPAPDASGAPPPYSLVTKTIVPVGNTAVPPPADVPAGNPEVDPPVNTQAAASQPDLPQYAPESSAPLPDSNGYSAGSTSTPAGFARPSSTLDVFTGAATKAGASVMSAFVLAAAVLLML